MCAETSDNGFNWLLIAFTEVVFQTFGKPLQCIVINCKRFYVIVFVQDNGNKMRTNGVAHKFCRMPELKKRAEQEKKNASLKYTKNQRTHHANDHQFVHRNGGLLKPPLLCTMYTHFVCG